MNSANCHEVLSEWIPQMELRPVPKKYIDRRDPLDVAKKATLKEPKPVELRIVFNDAEILSDDPERDIGNLLMKALEDAEAVIWAGCDRAPGAPFLIEIETTTRERSKALRVIQRILNKLKCPPSTVIEERSEPPIIYPFKVERSLYEGTSRIPKMEIGETREDFVEGAKDALMQPAPVRLQIIFKQADLSTDDPEIDIQEPLEEALEESEAGSWSGSGAEMEGLFVIDIETTVRERTKALNVIRRMLKKLKCPTTTVISECGEPPLIHPLAMEKSKRKGV